MDHQEWTFKYLKREAYESSPKINQSCITGDHRDPQVDHAVHSGRITAWTKTVPLHTGRVQSSFGSFEPQLMTITTPPRRVVYVYDFVFFSGLKSQVKLRTNIILMKRELFARKQAIKHVNNNTASDKRYLYVYFCFFFFLSFSFLLLFLFPFLLIYTSQETHSFCFTWLKDRTKPVMIWVLFQMTSRFFCMNDDVIEGFWYHTDFRPAFCFPNQAVPRSLSSILLPSIPLSFSPSHSSHYSFASHPTPMHWPLNIDCLSR